MVACLLTLYLKDQSRWLVRFVPLRVKCRNANLFACLRAGYVADRAVQPWSNFTFVTSNTSAVLYLDVGTSSPLRPHVRLAKRLSHSRAHSGTPIHRHQLAPWPVHLARPPGRLGAQLVPRCVGHATRRTHCAPLPLALAAAVRHSSRACGTRSHHPRVGLHCALLGRAQLRRGVQLLDAGVRAAYSLSADSPSTAPPC